MEHKALVYVQLLEILILVFRSFQNSFSDEKQKSGIWQIKIVSPTTSHPNLSS